MTVYKSANNMRKVCFSTLILFMALFLSDGILGWIGFPSEIEDTYWYPNNLSEKIKWIDGYYTLKTNERGIRYETIPDIKEHNSETRVVVLGDSFTEGQGVDAEIAWPSILERHFSTNSQKVRFINCGIAGEGPFEYLQNFYKVGLKYRPEKVIVMLYANDVENTISFDTKDPQWHSRLFLQDYELKPLRTGMKRWLHILIPRTYTMLRKVQKKFWENKPYRVFEDTLKTAKINGLPEERITQWKSILTKESVQKIKDGWMPDTWVTMPLIQPNYWVECLDLSAEDSEEKWRSMRALLEYLVEICRSRGIDIAFVYAPHAFQYDATYDDYQERLGLEVRKEWLTEETELEKRIRVWTKENNLPFINLTPLLRKKMTQDATPLNFHVDPHWNAHGHRSVATYLAEWISTLWPNLSPQE